MTIMTLFVKKIDGLVRAACISIIFAAVSSHADFGAPWVGEDLQGGPCKGGGQGYGPYDYTQRAQLSQNLKVVEKAHFTSAVESLSGGASTSRGPLADLDYTLRAFPNHHRALHAAIRYRMRLGKPIRHPQFSHVECYLQRAINYSPRDSVSHMLYGLHLHRLKKYEKALPAYSRAYELNPRDLEIQYNLALLHTDLKNFEQAKTLADQLYDSNFPLQGLKNRLIDAGHWDVKPSKSSP